MEGDQTSEKIVKEEQSDKEVGEEQPSEKAVEEEEVKWFECSICKLREVYDQKTNKPKFTPFITFNDESYIVKDPFTPSEKKQFFILGSDCNVCKKPVCQSNDCSIFYKKRYCQHCANTRKKVFPEQLHSKIKSIV